MLAVGFTNRLLTGLFDLLLAPFGALAPLWALVAMSCAVGVLMVWIFGRVSDQAAVGRVRDRIRGNLLGIRIFGDDVRLLFLLLGRVLGGTAAYLRLALGPMLVMLVPLALILIQLDLRFSARPLAAGERAVVTVKAREGTPLESLELRAPEGIAVETPGVRAPELREVTWRIRADRAGEHRLAVVAGGAEVTKSLVVGGGWGDASRRRTGAGIWQALLHPGEPPIPPAERIESIDLAYPALELSLLGWRLDWLVVFLVASLAFGFAVHRPLGVRL
jgi:hypothetical protein